MTELVSSRKSEKHVKDLEDYFDPEYVKTLIGRPDGQPAMAAVRSETAGSNSSTRRVNWPS